MKPQHWGGERQLFTEGIALDYLNNDNIVRKVNPPSEFN